MKRFIIGLILGIVLGLSSHFVTCYIYTTPPEVINDSIPIKLEQPEFFLEDTPTVALVMEACEYYNVKYSDIVAAQAILETGHFRSEGCTKDNNLFGLYNSRKQEFFKFNHWTESVKAYRDMVQYRYKEGDYYTWLDNIGYAEDSIYVAKVKIIRNRFI